MSIIRNVCCRMVNPTLDYMHLSHILTDHLKSLMNVMNVENEQVLPLVQHQTIENDELWLLQPLVYQLHVHQAPMELVVH